MPRRRGGDELVTRILPLRHADAAAAVPVVQPLVSKDGVLTAYPPTNRLVVVDAASNVERIAAVLRDLDVPGGGRPRDRVRPAALRARRRAGRPAPRRRSPPRRRRGTASASSPRRAPTACCWPARRPTWRARGRWSTRLDVALPPARRSSTSTGSSTRRPRASCACCRSSSACLRRRPRRRRTRGSSIMRSSLRDEAALPPYGYDGGMGEPAGRTAAAPAASRSAPGRAPPSRSRRPCASPPTRRPTRSS